MSEQTDSGASSEQNPEMPSRFVIPPAPGEVIMTTNTKNLYTMHHKIGEGFFGIVFACTDQWNNDLAAKILKANGTYEAIRVAALAETHKLQSLRHPSITYIYDTFEYRDTFYIITERCTFPLSHIFNPPFEPPIWLEPVARSLLQAVHYLHVNGYAHQDIHLGNVLIASSKSEMNTTGPAAIKFKLGDLGVSRLLEELDAANTMKDAIRPPEARDSKEFGPMDLRVDIYQIGLLLLQMARSEIMQFTPDEIVAGRPRELALQLPPPLNTALEKALRRHVMHRTENVVELWRDLKSPPGAAHAAMTLTLLNESPSPSRDEKAEA